MTTVPEADEVRDERVAETIRTMIAGHPQAAVRRIVLWMLAFVFVGLLTITTWAIMPALVVLALLALTDMLA